MVLTGSQKREVAEKKKEEYSDALHFNRSWCWTFYREADVERLRANPHQAFVCAKEVGGVGGMEHYQGYVRFANRQRWSWFEHNFKGFAEHPTELGEDGKPKRYWNHWEARKGTEPQARQYIVDVEGYLKTPRAHPKTQGEVLFDYGCQVESRPADSEELEMVYMVADRAPRWQIFKEHPLLYFKRRRDVIGLEEDVLGWHGDGVDYHPRNRYKKAASDPDL